MSNDLERIDVVAESEDSELIVARVAGRVTHHGLLEVPNPEDSLGTKAFSKQLLLNLSACKELDSTGVNWLLQLHRRCENANGQLVIHTVPPALLVTLKTLHLQSILHILDDEETARRFIRAH